MDGHPLDPLLHEGFIVLRVDWDLLQLIQRLKSVYHPSKERVFQI